MKISQKLIYSVIGVIALVFILYSLSSLFFYILGASIISLLCSPIKKILSSVYFYRFRISSTFATVITLVLLFIVFSSLILMFIPLILEEIDILSNYNTDELLNSLNEPLMNLEKKLKSYGINYDLRNQVRSSLQTLPEKIFESGFLVRVVDVISFIFSSFLALLAISFISFFMLKESHKIMGFLVSLVPEHRQDSFQKVLNEIKTMLRKYFMGLFIDVLLIITIMFIALYSLGLKYALLISFFAGVINVIPYLGPLIGVSFATLVTVTTGVNDDFYLVTLPRIWQVGIVYGIVQLLDAFLIQPTIFANTLKAHPLEIFLVIIAAGQIGGIIAMIIAVPSYTVFKIIGHQYFNNFRVIQAITRKMYD